MIQIRNRPYVCWRCLTQSRSGQRVVNSAGRNSINQPAGSSQRRSATTYYKSPLVGTFESTGIPRSAPAKQSTETDVTRKIPIRESLKLWTADKEARPKYSDEGPSDGRLVGGIANLLGRSEASGARELDQLKQRESEAGSFGVAISSGDTESAFVGGESRIPGDLVELQPEDLRAPVLAVYLGFFSGRHHFYTTTGKWMTSLGFSPLFTVSNYASVTELEPILSKIPKNATPDELNTLRLEDRGPSREDGAALIRKLTEFKNQTEHVYQANIAKLDGVETFLPHSRRIKHLSLFEIAEMLLPETLRNEHGFPPTALYATHTAIFRAGFAFSPLSPSRDSHRRDHLYEILPTHYTRIADHVASMVRAYSTANGRRQKVASLSELEGKTFGDFILMAREVVLSSRSTRQWTPHGIVSGPSGAKLQKVEWSQASQDIINFLELWASHDVFSPGSRYHTYGAMILRALELYDDATLDQNTAWSFLQEIGVVSSWEISSRYTVRFPNTTIVKGGGLDRATPPDIEDSKREDIAAGSRRDWTGSTVFCIDGPSTMIVDDGISLERTDQPDEFWLHVHTADPASVINPDSELCKFMELIPENIYLPGHFQAMLPATIGEDNSGDYKSDGLVKQFSLHTGAPALTFSAKVNLAGETLDYRVEPGTLDNVKYLDPDDVSAFCNEPPPPSFPAQSLTVGTPPDREARPPNRPMIAAQDLDQSSKDDLTILYRLAEAIKQRRLSKGAWPYFAPRPSVSVSFPGSADQDHSEDSMMIPPEPYIKVSLEPSMGCSVVANSMVLAGEIAARWCSSRGIPVPFRRDARSAENLPAALEFVNSQVYPLIEQGVQPSSSLRQQLSMLTGGIEISSEPGPYFLLGLDMYAKATSPLRRFSDLLVHWQIHAALAHERTTRRRIDPATDNLDEILPFSPSELKNTISLLQMREKMARSVSSGAEQWILQALVRAWQFEKTAPRTMRFTVDSNWRMGVIGHLDLFELRAVIELSGLQDIILLKNIKVGDQFEVELKDINVHSKDVVVRALRYFGQGDLLVDQVPEQHKLSGPASEHDRPDGKMEPALA